MATLEKQLREQKRKSKSWLAILIYKCASSQPQLEGLSQRLRSLSEPLLKPEILQGVIKNAMPEPPDHKETPNLKKRVLSRITSKKVKS